MTNYIPFLDSFFEQIAKSGLDISGLVFDHIAYQAASAADYEKIKPSFLELGTEASEEMIGGRRVAVFKLHEPITYKQHTFSALELIEPRADQQCNSEFQHAEFVVTQPFETYIDKYPQLKWDTSSMHRDDFAHLKLNFDNGLTLKFLKAPILEQVGKN